MVNYFLTAILLGIATYCLMTARKMSPISDKPSEMCLFCGDDPKEPGTFYCGACNSVFDMTGITWVFYQQEVDQITERLK